MTDEQMWRIAAVAALSGLFPIAVLLGEKALERWRKRHARRKP
jgi:hypothetical protein